MLWKIIVEDKLKLKGVFSGLRHFLATASPLKMMKNVIYLTLKIIFVLKIFKFLSWIFCRVEERFD